MIEKIITKVNDESYFRILGNIRDYPKKAVFNIEEIIPFYKYLCFQWEKDFTPFRFIELVHNKYYVCPIVVIIYLLFCKYGNNLMQNRKPFNIKKIIIIWNFLLSCFNMFVIMRLLPVLIYIIYHYSLTGLLIIPPIYMYAFGPVGLWICLFILSKYFELIDTCFLILRKKEVTLLHWFHHSTVLLYTWDTYYVELPAGVVFIFINAFVHTIMYFYYFLATLYNKPLKWSVVVTFIQIFQMILGILLTIYCLYITYIYKYNTNWEIDFIHKLKNNFSFDNGHYISRKNLFFACLMYLSYLYLFAKYFINRYVVKFIKKKKE
ncbi:fatty acid elongation protein, GNS1/SUR4 family, putative [Plasmodium relictum]|uniref:Elongation of fatty acids protein n=1 Tax=Plasmodium relictum TaxID=85471 RepID=A0A1J1HGU1_PLARL|nr:fatty acid elongation protein, GNS1/SUR4 family, putative [Plasmodium relictum]CRH03053.1 fatty acid elongation protein, GNS1/SUR4 family, putative [Plasmodium relictum]